MARTKQTVRKRTPPAPPSCLACKSPLCNEYMAMLQGHMLALRSRLVAQSAKLSYFEAAARLRYPSTPPKEAFTAAEEDWEKDSEGKVSINKERFFWCWFELADLWTDSMEPQAYVTFLKTKM